MKKLLIASIMIILASGVVLAKDLEITKQAGPYSVLVKVEKNPPSLGRTMFPSPSRMLPERWSRTPMSL